MGGADDLTYVLNTAAVPSTGTLQFWLRFHRKFCLEHRFHTLRVWAKDYCVEIEFVEVVLELVLLVEVPQSQFHDNKPKVDHLGNRID